MSISIAKIRYFHDTQDSIKSCNASGFVMTELEYVLMLARSVFDLLQEIISTFWKEHIRFSDPVVEANRRGKSLPRTFSKIVLKDKKHLRDAHNIETTFGIPLLLAKEYERHATFFSALRDMRDSTAHHGKSLDHVFTTEKGFCVSPTAKPFANFYSARNDKNDYYNENIVSLLPWLAHVIFGTIDACNGLMYTFGHIIRLPEEIAPGYKVFIRDPSSSAMLNLLEIANGASPWWRNENVSEVPY